MNIASVQIDVVALHVAVATVPLLQNISLCIEPGQLCAVLGPSGAGKTTLLDVIAGRSHAGYQRGLILFNGQPTRQKSVVYVSQEEENMAELTVEETLRFAARLRCPPGEHVDTQVADMLDLFRSRYFAVRSGSGRAGIARSLSRYVRPRLTCRPATDVPTGDRAGNFPPFSSAPHRTRCTVPAFCSQGRCTSGCTCPCAITSGRSLLTAPIVPR
jgi:ABC-type taurine transport system ATPase subunit